jgi:putative ABC transport system permease protein
VSRLQVHVPYATMRNRTIALLVLGRGDPTALVPAVRGQIRALDPTLAPYEVMSMADRRRLTFWEYRLLSGLFAQLAVVALVLAGAGVYGVVAYGVARRRRELGVRLVLGASPRGLLGSVVRATAIPAVIGGAAGLILAFWLSRLLVGLLYGVEASDPVTFTVAGGAMIGVALLAAWLPARRALKLDPADALRTE